MVVTSIQAAEYIGSSNTAHEIQWQRNVLSELTAQKHIS